MENIQTEIGEIISVNGNVISVQLSDTMKSNMPVIDGIVYRIGQIGLKLWIAIAVTSSFISITNNLNLNIRII